MKKVYAMLALVLGLGLSATAAPELAVKKAAASATEKMTYIEPVSEGIAESPVTIAKAPAKVITSTEEMVGMKEWSGIRMFGKKATDSGTIINGPQSDICFVDDPKATRITLVNFPTSGLNLRLNVNMAKKEVSFNNETFVGSITTQTGGSEEVYIYVRKHNGIKYDEAKGLWGYTNGSEDATKAVGKILDDGSISFDGYTLSASNPTFQANDQVYIMLNTANIVIKPGKYNTPVESEYTYVGDGEFKDPFFAPAFGSGWTIPVNNKAQIYTKKVEGSTMIAVKNPYKNIPGQVPLQSGGTQNVDNFWKEVGMMAEGDGDGWLVFQVFTGEKFINYPNVAACLQLVPCGLSQDESEAEDGSEISAFYPYNEEGYAVYNGGEDELLNLLVKYEDTATAFSEVVENVLSIRNVYFGMGMNPLSPYWWGHYEVPGDPTSWVDATRIVGTVTLPEGWNDQSGINSIAGDNVNAPVKYYNLQGIELSAPVKGQLTIKKQGNKTVKFIAK